MAGGLRRMELMKRDGPDCSACGERMMFVQGNHTKSDRMATIDHIQPKSKGGTASLDNTRLMHKSCNKARGDVWDGLDRRGLVVVIA